MTADRNFNLEDDHMTTKAKSKQPQRLKRPRGAVLRAIVAGHISTKEAHERGYMGRDELSGRTKLEKSPN